MTFKITTIQYKKNDNILKKKR